MAEFIRSKCTCGWMEKTDPVGAQHIGFRCGACGRDWRLVQGQWVTAEKAAQLEAGRARRRAQLVAMSSDELFAAFVSDHISEEDLAQGLRTNPGNARGLFGAWLQTQPRETREFWERPR